MIFYPEWGFVFIVLFPSRLLFMLPLLMLDLIRYGIVLKHPGQPLLRLKQSHNAHNLLVNFNDEGWLMLEFYFIHNNLFNA